MGPRLSRGFGLVLRRTGPASSAVAAEVVLHLLALLLRTVLLVVCTGEGEGEVVRLSTMWASVGAVALAALALL